MKIPSWAYEVFWEAHEGIFVFLCQFSEIFRAFLASFRFSRNFLCATVTHVVSHSFSLIQNRIVDYCARIAHLTQSIASVNAKHCIRQRKALHLPTQSFAIANAKLCNSQRKALQSPTQSFAIANAKLCIKGAFITKNGTCSWFTLTTCSQKIHWPARAVSAKALYILLLSTLLLTARP